MQQVSLSLKGVQSTSVPKKPLHVLRFVAASIAKLKKHLNAQTLEKTLKRVNYFCKRNKEFVIYLNCVQKYKSMR